MSDFPKPLPDSLRERIAMVRVLCIGFMIYVHVPDNAISSLAIGVPLPSLLFQGFVVEGVGRASAALLSVVSGLLTAVALTKSAPLALYRRRFRSIIVPMVLWSTVTVALYALISLVQPTFLALDGRSPGEALLYYLNTVFFLTDQPLGPTLHLGFLRDLFVCILLSPLLLALVRRFGVAVPLAAGLLYLADAESVVILRPLILFAFSIGIWFAVRDFRLDRLDRLWPLWVVLSILATMLVMASGSERGLASAPAVWFEDHGFDLRETLVYPLSRLCGGLAIWTLAAKLVGGSWSRRFARFSPYVFVAFCSHFLVLTLLWEGVVRRLVGGVTTPAYAAWFAVSPLVAMLAAAILVEILARTVPPLAALLTGGRAGGVRKPKVRSPDALARAADDSPDEARSPTDPMAVSSSPLPARLPQ